MTVGHALGSPCCGSVAIGILDSVETVLHKGFGVVEREGEAMTKTDVDDKEWSGAEILAELQILVEAKAVG